MILYPKDPHTSTSELCHISPNPTLRRFQGSRIAIPQRSQSSPVDFPYGTVAISTSEPHVASTIVWYLPFGNAEAVGKLEKDWILRYQKG